jgi:DNA mismatch repair protein MutS2
MFETYPDSFEEKTGFNRIREMVLNKCLSTMGTEWVEKMSFSDDFNSVSLQLNEVAEFCRIIREFEDFPDNHFYDLRNALRKIRIEGRFLEVSELFDLKRSLESVKSIILFFKNIEDESFPLLRKKTERVQIFPYICERADQIINKYGHIRDNASAELAHIKRSILALQTGISKRLQAILKQAAKDGLADENASVTIRDGRAVIPVSAANKRKIKGIVYDESATGKTAYIEPNEIVEMNNELRELEYAERREIIRILTKFSDDIRPYLDDILCSYDFLGEIDFIRAKALLAVEFNSITPELVDIPLIDWHQAVHPLLLKSLTRENRKIVPLDIHIDSQNHILLISGPNAGGKSVCLKTVGLLQYMVQCGLAIPAGEGSKTGIFRKIFIDIGDEQSLENDLSTYSSHLINMKYFIKNSDDKTLVLIDEFGSGTEPALGAAIAESILEELVRLRTFGVITTHYTNLKHFASSTEGIINGAMLYDSQSMNPLFRLDIGKPGSSFAFEIAGKIGLPEIILQAATQKAGKKHIDFDRNLRKIDRDKRYWENKRQKIRKVEKMLDSLAANYEAELQALKKSRKEIMESAREEAKLLLAGVNKKIENTISEIKKAQAEKERTKKAREELEAVKAEVKNTPADEDERIAAKIVKLHQKEQKRNRRRPPGEKSETIKKPVEDKAELQPGDKVRIKGQELIGDLIELNEKNAIIAFGQLITTIPRARIDRLSNKEARQYKRQSKGGGGARLISKLSDQRLNFKSEIDVRGHRAEEALANIREFIDQAVMFEVRKLRILHGKGHGILKETIRNYLGSEPLVHSFNDEHVDLGGAGITVVELSL